MALASPSLRTLRSLAIQYCHFNVPSVEWLTIFSYLNGLQELSLRYCDSAAILAAVTSHCVALQRLNGVCEDLDEERALTFVSVNFERESPTPSCKVIAELLQQCSSLVKVVISLPSRNSIHQQALTENPDCDPAAEGWTDELIRRYLDEFDSMVNALIQMAASVPLDKLQIVEMDS
jgi:hypothetical protein